MSDVTYDTDVYAWAHQQAAALRAKDWPALDVANLAEEIESLGNEQEHAVASHLKILTLHLLKVTQQRLRRLSWLRSIRNARDEIDWRVQRNPSLKPGLPEFLRWAYPRARKAAAEETRLPLATFPEACPWSLAQLLDDDWLSPA